MTDKPIIFSGPMVRAILEGRKTQTRRLLKPQPAIRPEIEDGYLVVYDGEAEVGRERLPYRPGDLLWVRENYRLHRNLDRHKVYHGVTIWYGGGEARGEAGKLRPAIHMPRYLSRLTLEATAVKVERLQDISREDAVAEGVVEDDGNIPNIFYLPGSWMISGVNAPKGRLPIGQHDDPRLVYRDLINNIHGGDLWSANPWVVAITFTAHKKNIAALIAERPAA